jgi:hypothetical protein
MNYSEEEKESVAHLEWLLDEGILSSEDEPFIETVLNLIPKQSKIIDKMAEQLAGLAIWNDNIEEALILGDKEEVKEYFKKVVDEDVKD